MTETLKQMEIRANKVAQSYMGETGWPTIILAAGVITGYVAILIATASGKLNLWAAAGLTTIVVYGCYTVLHDAVHGSIHGKNKSLKWLNQSLGFIGAQIMGASFTAHRKEHLAHHRNTNKPDLDPDLFIPDGRFSSFVKGIFLALPAQPKYYIQHHWKKAPQRERSIFIAEYAVAIAWRIAFLITFWKAGLFILIIGGLMGVALTLLLFAWLVHRPYTETGRYHDTATIIFPKVVDPLISRLWLFQNYHSIHHLFPRVPFYRYRQLFMDIEDIMIANDAPILRVGDGTRRGKLPSIARPTS